VECLSGWGKPTLGREGMIRTRKRMGCGYGGRTKISGGRKKPEGWLPRKTARKFVKIKQKKPEKEAKKGSLHKKQRSGTGDGTVVEMLGSCY